MPGPAVAPLGLRSQVVHMLAVEAYHRRAAVLVGQGIRMRQRLEQVDRLEERRPGLRLRQIRNQRPDQHTLSSSCLQLQEQERGLLAVRRPPGHIAGRPGKGWPLLRCVRM